MGAASREIWLAPMTDPKALLSSDKLANFGLIGRRIILHPGLGSGNLRGQRIFIIGI